MITPGHMLSQIVAWATRETNVRRLILVGSRARVECPDDLADIDVQVYAETSDPYTSDDTWLTTIAAPWLCVRDEYIDGDVTVPTRLVIFESGVKVDFAFYPARVMSEGVRTGLPHRILLDKDRGDRCAAATASRPIPPALPDELEFRQLVEEFWFEAYHVAKYLTRDELWLAKSRDQATKRFLWRMIEWHEQIARGHAPDPCGEGRRASVSEDTWAALDATFSGFGRDESWSAMLATTRLFQRLSAEIAATLGFTYPGETVSNMSQLILSLRGR
jgi:aminoglycoside 6-adenylyltransferase